MHGTFDEPFFEAQFQVMHKDLMHLNNCMINPNSYHTTLNIQLIYEDHRKAFSRDHATDAYMDYKLNAWTMTALLTTSFTVTLVTVIPAIYYYSTVICAN